MTNHFTIFEALQNLAQHRKQHEQPSSHPACFKTLLRHGTLEMELYQPIQVDHQQPHSKDELYVIATGGAGFEMAGEPRVSVGPGDVLFVPAGTEHRFVDFGQGFSTWVFLYGPEGGENPSQ